MKEKAIGMFDSGVGGLSVLRVMERQLPQEDVIYYADTAHLPYGEKMPEEIAGYGRRIAGYFKEQGVKLLVIACNTASVHSLQAVQEVMGETKVMGVLQAGSRAALEGGAGGSVGVIATKATIHSLAYPQAIHQLDETTKVISHATPRLVTLVEEGDVSSSRAKRIVREELRPFLSESPARLLLGCTHFPGLSHLIEEILPGVELVDPAYALVEEIKKYLDEKGLRREEGGAQIKYYVSGEPESFEKSGAILLGRPITGAQKLPL